jgi:hypothetical protein
MSAAASASAALAQAIGGCFAPSGGFVLEELRTRPWASASFRGARHELAFRLEGAAADEAANRFLAGFDAAVPKLAGQIVASVSLLADERRPGCARIRIEAVTVDVR